MTYGYSCESCHLEQDVIKSVQDIDRPELCSKCNNQMTRVFSFPKIHFNIDTSDAYFSPSLGIPVRNKTHEQAEAKARGFECIGNEIPRKHLKVERQEY